MPFQGDVVVKADTGKYWILERELIYVGKRETFVVPTGMSTDFASVPRPFVWLLPPYGAYTKAAILHDYLCQEEAGVSRADADGLFRRAMRELDVPVIRRWMMWAAVRLDSRLSGITPVDFLLFLLVGMPSLLFVALPGVVVLVWLLAFWGVEMLVFVLSKPFTRKPINRPRIGVRSS